MDVQLGDFDPRFAATVASWVQSDISLLWLAPRTEPPLTPEKVLAWARERDRPVMLHAAGAAEPLGYAEINATQGRSRQVWLGHVVVDTAHRGRGIGRAFVHLLIQTAFDEPDVDSISLVAFPENRAAIACYRRCGFRVVGEEFHQFMQFAPAERHHRMLRFELRRDDWCNPSNTTVYRQVR